MPWLRRPAFEYYWNLVVTGFWRMRYIRTGNRRVRTHYTTPIRRRYGIGGGGVRLIGQKRPCLVENHFARSLKRIAFIDFLIRLENSNRDLLLPLSSTICYSSSYILYHYTYMFYIGKYTYDIILGTFVTSVGNLLKCKYECKWFKVIDAFNIGSEIYIYI